VVPRRPFPAAIVRFPAEAPKPKFKQFTSIKILAANFNYITFATMAKYIYTFLFAPQIFFI
jgi:hypothetical protein